MVRETVDVEIEFRVNDAVALLESWNLVSRDADSKLHCCGPDEAMRRIEAFWDNSLRA
jgi:hypothetical protein